MLQYFRTIKIINNNSSNNNNNNTNCSTASAATATAATAATTATTTTTTTTATTATTTTTTTAENWSELATKFEPVSSKEDRKRKILHQIHVDPLLEVPSMKFCVYISLSTCRTAPSNLDLLGVVGTMGQKRSANRLFQVQKLVKTAYEWFDQKWNELENMYSI